MKKKDTCTCPLCRQGFTPAAGMNAGEYLARGILAAYARMQGDRNNTLPCPRCGEYHMPPDDTCNTLSRRFDVYICDACARREVVEAKEGKDLPLEAWRVVAELLDQS